LPGEVLELRSGELWVNDKPATYAADMVGLVYREDTQASSFAVALTEGQPFTLQENEYFLLGDYSTRAMDSRYMGPIAGQDIVGVVTWIYWPPPRWRIFR
jgi:signal peptidase I